MNDMKSTFPMCLCLLKVQETMMVSFIMQVELIVCLEAISQII